MADRSILGAVKHNYCKCALQTAASVVGSVPHNYNNTLCQCSLTCRSKYRTVYIYFPPASLPVLAVDDCTSMDEQQKNLSNMLSGKGYNISR